MYQHVGVRVSQRTVVHSTLLNGNARTDEIEEAERSTGDVLIGTFRHQQVARLSIHLHMIFALRLEVAKVNEITRLARPR